MRNRALLWICLAVAMVMLAAVVPVHANHPAPPCSAAAHRLIEAFHCH